MDNDDLPPDARATVDGSRRSRTLIRSNFHPVKRTLLWMQNGGEKGVELDEIHVQPTAIPHP